MSSTQNLGEAVDVGDTAHHPLPDDVLTPELRRELAIWRAATGVPADERSLAGPVLHHDREAVYHRNLTRRINARYGEALTVWADQTVDYVGACCPRLPGHGRRHPRSKPRVAFATNVSYPSVPCAGAQPLGL